MARLDDLLGVLAGVKRTAKSAIDSTYHQFQRNPNLFNGFYKTYEPLDTENGDRFPPEGQIVQHSVETMLRDVALSWSRLLDVQATVDATNQVARASFTFEGWTSPELPAVTLLWLEKNLTDLRTMIEKVPVLDPAKVWSMDSNTGLYATEPRRTIKTRKVRRNHVKAEATERHPAQVEIFTDDETIGHWTGADLSGAMPGTRKRLLLDRVDAALEAIKLARNEANRTEAVDRRFGAEFLGRVLA